MVFSVHRRRLAAALAPSSHAAGLPPPTHYVDFAKSARSDVEQLLGEVKDGPWIEKLRDVSKLALDLWPPEAPHWRVVGPLIIPPTRHGSARAMQELVAAFKGKGSTQGLDAMSRAHALRTLCAVRLSPAEMRKVQFLLEVLVDSGSPKVTYQGSLSTLAGDVPFEELLPCLKALGEAAQRGSKGTLPPLVSKESPLANFVEEATFRLTKLMPKLSTKDLLDLRGALRSIRGSSRDELDKELQSRLQQASGSTELKAETIPSLIASARILGEIGALRSAPLRSALLPDSLGPHQAAEIVQHALPLDGSSISANEFVIAMASARTASGARVLTPTQITAALQGVLALQASADAFSLQQAAVILRATWPRVAHFLPNFSPGDLCVALRAFWWQLQYSGQELALLGSTLLHPRLGQVSLTPKAVGAASLREQKADEELKSKLLWPTIGRLGEMSLSQVAAALSAIAPPVLPPDLLSAAERQALGDAVTSTFTSSGLPSTTKGKNAAEDWWEEYWSAEVATLSISQLLELACGLREAGSRPKQWPLAPILAELQQRLHQASGQPKPVELSHFLLLRMCRIMDIWQGHEVQNVLQSLLLSPEAIKPLPISYSVAMLQALCRFGVPKAVPLRLTAALVDRADLGELQISPKQWATILEVVLPLEEARSWERVTPRILQRLVPHLTSLPPSALASLMSAMASKADLLKEVTPRSALQVHLPSAASEAIREAISAGKWDFAQVVEIFSNVSRLGWYQEELVASLLGFCGAQPLLEPHSPLLLPIVKACTALHIHHAPLLHKLVHWYCWCYSYLWPRPLPTEKVDELIQLSEELLQLSFQSMELHGILAENLLNPNATSRQKLILLSALARFAHFPPEFKDVCNSVCSPSASSEHDRDLASLSKEDLINAFNVHLCGVFDGPAALKWSLSHEEDMKSFFQVHTSQKWYQKQDEQRFAFLQSDVFETLGAAAEAEGLKVKPGDPGEVYHVEFVEVDAKERLSKASSNSPLALVCVSSKEQLRWYVPITAGEATGGVLESQNRCHHFRFMFRGAVQKLRHLQAMGYRPVVIWLSEWSKLTTEEQRREYLRTALGEPGRQNTAFRPGTAEEQEAYR